jgi:NADH-quinone oxidoreductase subunit C
MVNLKIERADLNESITSMKNKGFNYLIKITAVDYVDHVEVVYFLRNLEKALDETVEVEMVPGDLWVPTIMPLYSAADWYERELFEMFGIEIKGRKAKRLLLEKWDGKGSPLRKNFVWAEPYEKM